MSAALKPATTISSQISMLKQRGMDVDDELATTWLSNVGYYRLSAYWYPAWQIDGQGKRVDSFVPNTTFQNVADLYEADRKLRTLIHDGIERIEIALRARITNHLCLTDDLGPLVYEDPSHFRPEFNHLDWMRTVYGRLSRGKNRSKPIEHYHSHYAGKFPLWVIADVLDFVDISKLYSAMNLEDQRSVAEGLNLRIDFQQLSKDQRNQVQRRHPFAGWLEQLTVVRNTSAHHGRLWNKSFAPASTEALKSTGFLTMLPTGQSERVFGTLVVMAHLLREISPGTTWPDKVLKLLNESFLTNPLVNPASLGIPNNWDQSTI